MGIKQTSTSWLSASNLSNPFGNLVGERPQESYSKTQTDLRYHSFSSVDCIFCSFCSLQETLLFVIILKKGKIRMTRQILSTLRHTVLQCSLDFCCELNLLLVNITIRFTLRGHILRKLFFSTFQLSLCQTFRLLNNYEI